MSEFNLNTRAWDWERGWEMGSTNDDIVQAKQDEQNRQAVLKEKEVIAAQEEETARKRAQAIAALSTSGFQASGTNTARSFLTSL